MLVSVVVRTKDEAERLRLTLTSLACQSLEPEVVVVNDGSSDRTAEVLAEAASDLALRVVTHPAARGRSAASNAGARVARGELLLFLDGDTLAGPQVVERHRDVHRTHPDAIGRGETYHLRGTRFLRDPETGTPWPNGEAHLRGKEPRALERMRITRREIVENFAAVDARAEPGIYPGTSARRLHELEMEALHADPECAVLWAAASGSNLSVRRDAFERAGGFREDLDLNEHRELALRLYADGLRLVPVDGARTYHMIHRTPRDPLEEIGWQRVFYRAHPLPEVELLPVFWASLAPQSRVPLEARINSLQELALAARTER
ncbi:MAG: glycosyltransferase family 2 protein [Candidatus Eremiobacteraeota bacterium]|nr:glycosyltransferase family 2 protein [Candidatus Eremiobacteraeota bacterium]